jgi:hypothetical protein
MTTPTVYGSATADGGSGPQPTNAIVVQGIPQVRYFNVETATYMYAGRLVAKGTTDHDVTNCGASGKCMGVAGYEHSPKKYRPATRATIYQTSDQIAVLSGPGVVVMIQLDATAQTIITGDKLVPGATGYATKATAATIGTGSVAVLSTGAEPTIPGSIPTEGLPIAEAMESVQVYDIAGAWIMAKLLI